MFTKEEVRQINKSRRTLVKDMRKIFNIYPYQDIEVPVKLQMPSKYGYNWHLKISKKQIIIESDNGTYTRLYPRNVSANREDGYKAHFQFISQYEDVREEIVRIVTRRANEKNENIERLSKVSDKYTKTGQKESKKLESTVTIDIPNSLNAKEIIVSEEEGKKIGIIDFGAQTIKIVTEGNIVLVNKPKEEVKTKRR